MRGAARGLGRSARPQEAGSFCPGWRCRRPGASITGMTGVRVRGPGRDRDRAEAQPGGAESRPGGSERSYSPAAGGARKGLGENSLGPVPAVVRAPFVYVRGRRPCACVLARVLGALPGRVRARGCLCVCARRVRVSRALLEARGYLAEGVS